MATKLDERVETTLPPGFTVRGARLEDVNPSLELFNRWSRSILGTDEIIDAATIRNE
jgi:hypothetical protein